jgi:hypothetical protein
MRIISIGNFGNPSWDGSLPDEEHIAGALEELGHEVVRMQREEVGAFTEQCYFVLVSQWDGYPPNLITTLKTNTQGAPIVYWAFDYQVDGQEWHEQLVKGADLYLSKRIADSRYPNWQWLSQDFAPKFLDSKFNINNYERDIDVLFTGSYLPWATERNETLKAIDEKFNLVIHSVNAWEGFKDIRPPIMDEGLSDLYARAKIVISIDHTLEAGYWSDRNSQIMACEGFVLFRYISLSEVRFKDYIQYFYSIEDCLDKITYWLGQDAKRDVKANLGRAFANQNLRVIHRVEDLLTIVESL